MGDTNHKLLENLLKGERAKFIIYLYRYFIQLRNTIDKIRNNSDELDCSDYDVLTNIYKNFLNSEKERGNGD